MSSTDTPVHVLILAGGAGTRFWPASRAARPKQLLPLIGGEPLIAATARRVLPLCAGGGSAGWERLWIATGQHLVAATRAALPDVPERRLLVEPAPRNTAPCIAWAAATIAREDPDAIVVVLPSDHHIADVPRFLEALRVAVASARGGAITTIGVRPTHPETGFGYIEAEAGAGAGSAAPRRALRFVEKPDRERAAQFVASGRFLWNAGMFIFRAADMLAAVRAHLPALAEGLDEIDGAAALGAAAEAEAVERVFPRLPAISIDHGVMEHVAGLAVVPGDFGWSDLGSWQSAWELADKDEQGNSAPAGAVLVDARGNHVVDLRARPGGAAEERRVIALVGVEGLVVVETDDALLVVPRVCVPGTIGVDALLEVESYPAVHQLVSTVSGALVPGTTLADLLDATFPAGSMTGAPKLSAMTILHRLEAAPRGVFSGCFGWVGDDGALDLAMVIRSIVVRPDGAYVGAGGGITWRSDAAAEVAEVGIKARGPLAALGAGLPPGW